MGQTRSEYAKQASLGPLPRPCLVVPNRAVSDRASPTDQSVVSRALHYKLYRDMCTLRLKAPGSIGAVSDMVNSETAGQIGTSCYLCFYWAVRSVGRLRTS